MDRPHLFSDNFNAVIRQCILQREDTLLIPRNNFGREDNNIAFMEFHITVFTCRNARERRARFALGPCAEIKHMRRRHRARIIFINHMANIFEQTDGLRRRRHTFH